VTRNWAGSSVRPVTVDAYEILIDKMLSIRRRDAQVLEKGLHVDADLLVVAVDTGPGGRFASPAVWVPEFLPMSCDLPILVEEAAEAVASLDLVNLGWCAMRERV
jgi:hypothetical protein